jgi:hypothetical protein
VTSSLKKHGWHWPDEEQHANAFEEFGDLSDDGVAATRIKAAWAPLLPPFDLALDPERPEFDNVGRNHG